MRENHEVLLIPDNQKTILLMLDEVTCNLVAQWWSLCVTFSVLVEIYCLNLVAPIVQMVVGQGIALFTQMLTSCGQISVTSTDEHSTCTLSEVYFILCTHEKPLRDILFFNIMP